MARAVLVVCRRPSDGARWESQLAALNRKLTGDNIEPRAPITLGGQRPCVALLNANGAVARRGASIALGALLSPAADWHVPGSPVPDGSFALLRADDASIELVADATASRTLWYAFTDRELIASTSQRAIVTLLGSFALNRNVLPWMLSSGTLGPADGWDTRLRRLQPNERVRLDRSSWQLRSTVEPNVFRSDNGLTRDEHLERLRAAVTAACRLWSFDSRKWLVTLSGGADSRSLLCLLHNRGIQSVTWGLSSTSARRGSDAHVARTVAEALAVPHRFFDIEPRGAEPETVFDRFLAVGEGRVARISGYVDGFKVWKTLFDEGYEGVVRGDEAFGAIPVGSPYAVRHSVSLTTLDDFFSPAEVESFELPAQHVPTALGRSADETLATWRDRLYQQFRVPSLIAGLTDLKTAYVEVATPLLAGSVLECVRALPDELRTNKQLWRDLVALQLPGVPLATRVAIPPLEQCLRDVRVLELLLSELASERAATLLAPLLRTRCCATLRRYLQGTGGKRVKTWRPSPIARAVPARLRSALRIWRRPPQRIDPLVLAFRAFVIVRMNALLTADARRPPAGMRSAINT